MEAFLIRRGFDVDVGVIEQNVRDESGKNVRKQLEIDFVVNRGDERCYIQSALSINDPEKKEQEIASLIRIPDSFKKIVVVKDYVKPWWMTMAFSMSVLRTFFWMRALFPDNPCFVETSGKGLVARAET